MASKQYLCEIFDNDGLKCHKSMPAYTLNVIAEYYYLCNGDTNCSKILTKIDHHIKRNKHCATFSDYFCHTSAKFILDNKLSICGKGVLYKSRGQVAKKDKNYKKINRPTLSLKESDDNLYVIKYTKALQFFRKNYDKIIDHIDLHNCLKSFYVLHNSKYPNVITNIIMEYVFQHYFKIYVDTHKETFIGFDYDSSECIFNYFQTICNSDDDD